MTNPFKRGSAPNRAQPDYARPGSFKSGHEKRGGRKRGTPNLISADYRKAILEAAYRIGNDGNGKDGIVGYFKWVAVSHPAIFGTQLSNLLPLEFAERDAPEKPRRTMEEINEWVRDYIGLTGKNRAEEKTTQAESRSAWDWTGQPFPVGTLMQIAVANPKAFGTAIAAAFLRPPTARRGVAALSLKGRTVSNRPNPMMVVHVGRSVAKLKKQATAPISSNSPFLRTTLWNSR